MVSSFSTRLLELSNVCDPIERKHGNEGNGDYISTISDSNVNSRRAHDSQPTLSEKSSYKRQGYYYAHTHQHHTNDAAASSNKRRRQKEDLRYAAATIQQSLSDAGHHDARDMSSILQNRRERALPMGSVDMSTVKLVTSAEFDMNEKEDMKGEQDDGEENKEENTYDVNSMFMLSSLIQSTRQYYSFSNDDTTTTASAAVQASSSSNGTVNQPRSTTQSSNNSNNNAMTTQTYHNINDEDISEGTSTWTPSPPITTNDDGVESSTNELLNDYLKKNIDNDNRSDGLSSDMADGRSQSSDSVSSCSLVGGSEEVDCQQQQQVQELQEAEEQQTMQEEKSTKNYERVVFNGHYSIVG